MNRLLLRFALSMACLTMTCQVQTMAKKNDVIQTKVPKRPAGQHDVLQLTVPKMDVVRVGFIGLGMRGPGAVERWSQIAGTDIVALCDIDAAKVDSAQKILERAGRHRAVPYSGSAEAYKKMCERADIDLIYIATDWVNHTPMALYAMNHGKNVAIEVPAATSLEEIWSLINTSERTRKHCMMLENCVYDFFEIAALNMAQKGLFGEVMHVEGAYIHNLDDYWKDYWNNWRLDFNHHHAGDVYATHGIGPDCQVLNIHRGDRMEYLVSMDTKAVNGPKHVEAQTGAPCTDFQNGDQTSTMIRTARGKTMLIQHNVMTPRPYNRMFQIVGTEGYASKYPVQELAFRPQQLQNEGKISHENLTAHEAVKEEVRKQLLENYTPEFVKELEATAKKVGGHGGMDYIMDYRLVYCLRHGLPLDMDVYDLAEWCCIGELSRISIAHHSAPVAVPDFTRGAWDRIKGFSYHFAE